MYSAGHRVPVRVKFIEQPATKKMTAPKPAQMPEGTPYGVPPDFKPQ